MLKASDMRYKQIWQKWNEFLNIAFLSGFVENIRTENGRIFFDLRQTAFISHGLKVVLDRDSYLPAAIIEGAPVKIFARLQQDVSFEYNTIVLRPIYCARAGLHEIPSENSFLSIGRDSEHKVINPYITLSQLSDMSKQRQSQYVKKFQNNVEIAGFVLSKKQVADDCIEFDVWNQKNRILPCRIYGKASIINKDELKLYRPVKLQGRVEVKEIILGEEPKKQIYIRAESIVNPLVGKEIPKDPPNWYIEAYEKMKKAASGQASTYDNEIIKEDIENNPVINESELVEENLPKDLFKSDEDIKFEE
jgi:hypothetical protein